MPEIPCNPEGPLPWSVETLAWWTSVWSSPMAGQYMDPDRHGLGRVAVLVEMYNRVPKATLLAEIRLQEARFGLSPLDRSRLQWEIGKTEDADKRRRPKVEPSTAVSDPRKVLRIV